MNRRNLIAALVVSVCLSPTAEAQPPSKTSPGSACVRCAG